MKLNILHQFILKKTICVLAIVVIEKEYKNIVGRGEGHDSSLSIYCQVPQCQAVSSKITVSDIKKNQNIQSIVITLVL